MKVFVDTNILVDLVYRREEFFPDAQRLFGMGYDGKVQLVVSALSIVNAVYLSRRHGLPEQEVRMRLLDIVSFTEVASLTGDVVSWALECGWSDYEDATQYRSAHLSGADCIVTRDQKGYSKALLPVYSVEELMARLSGAEELP